MCPNFNGDEYALPILSNRCSSGVNCTEQEIMETFMKVNGNHDENKWTYIGLLFEARNHEL